jgi:hypothetical protein
MSGVKAARAIVRDHANRASEMGAGLGDVRLGGMGGEGVQKVRNQSHLAVCRGRPCKPLVGHTLGSRSIDCAAQRNDKMAKITAQVTPRHKTRQRERERKQKDERLELVPLFAWVTLVRALGKSPVANVPSATDLKAEILRRCRFRIVPCCSPTSTNDVASQTNQPTAQIRNEKIK